jgi:flagellar assembly protein FliH
MIDENFSENILEKIAQIARDKGDKVEVDSSKFLFESNLFGALSKDQIKEEEPPPPPIFSEEELEAAKTAAYEDGKRAAATEAQNSREQAVSETLNRIAFFFATEFDAEKQREKIYEAEAVALSLSIFKTLFPFFTKTHGLEEVKIAITDIIQDESGKGKIRIELSPNDTEPLSAHLKQLTIENAEERLNIISNETFTDGQFKVIWDDGGAVRDAKKMAGTVEAILQQALAGQPVSRHDKDGIEHAEQDAAQENTAQTDDVAATEITTDEATADETQAGDDT